jgi:hypothetical protein
MTGLVTSSDEPSLEQVHAKLRRAKQHRDELAERITPDLRKALGPALIETRYSPNDEYFSIQVANPPRVPDELSLLAGDIIQNYRVSLEYLAYNLVWLHQGQPWGRTKFPIVERLSLLEGTGTAAETVARMDSSHAAIIKRHQPLAAFEDWLSLGVGREMASRAKANEPLADLEYLSSEDRHRLLLDRSVIAQNMRVEIRTARDCNPQRDTYMRQMPLDRGELLGAFRANPIGSDPHIDVAFDFRPEVGINGRPALVRLDEIGGKVLEIIKDFEPFF